MPGWAIVGSAESRSIRSRGYARSLAHSFTHCSRKPEVAVKNFPVDVWWPVYEARTAHFAVFGVSGVVHQRVYRGLGHDGMSSQRCWTRERGEAREGRGSGGLGLGEEGGGGAGIRGQRGGKRSRALRAVSAEGGIAGVRGRSEVAVVVAVGG